MSDIDCYTLSDYLIQHRVLTREKWEHIQSTEPTDRRRNRALMNWLLDTNNPEAFPVLRDALDKENHWLLEVIDRPTKGKMTIKPIFVCWQCAFSVAGQSPQDNQPPDNQPRTITPWTINSRTINPGQSPPGQSPSQRRSHGHYQAKFTHNIVTNFVAD